MSVCEHDIYCIGKGGAHDAATLGFEGLAQLRRETKPLLRSGNPFKKAVGKALLARVNTALAFLPKDEEDA